MSAAAQNSGWPVSRFKYSLKENAAKAKNMAETICVSGAISTKPAKPANDEPDPINRTRLANGRPNFSQLVDPVIILFRSSAK